MRKFFDRKAPNTSKDCNKLSKSVSHKTLVGGTTTIVTGIKQTMCFYGCCTNKPLSAVGTLTSLLCNSAKVMENILQMSPVFRLIKIFSLVAVFCMSNINESQAAISCVFSDGGKTVTITGTGNDTVTTYACDSNNSSSTDSEWTYNSNWKKIITTANIGSGISDVGQLAFYQASNLASVTISEGVSSIGRSSFSNASKLTTIILPESIEAIEGSAFDSATSLTNITLPKNISSIGNFAFAKTGLTNITIPEGVESIGSYAFSGAKNLASITLPKSIESMGGYAFYATNLTTIIIPENLPIENVNKWESNVFKGEWNILGVSSITCVKADGSAGGDESACTTVMARFLPDENGNCQSGINYCLMYVRKVGNTCVGQYFGSVSGDGTCVNKSSCTGAGNYINTDTRQCVTPASCTGMYVADTVNKKCFKMPGCVNFADGACQECDSGYLKQSGACVEESACNGRNYASGDECKEMPEGCIGMSGDSCATCDGEHLEKDGSCISASAGCGAGYKDMGGWCNRIRYTPAEAAPLLHNDNTNEVTITFRK